MDIKAGGDIVAGDKITNTKVSSSFRNQIEKDEFSSALNQLQSLLRDLSSQIGTSLSSMALDNAGVIGGLIGWLFISLENAVLYGLVGFDIGNKLQNRSRRPKW